MSRIEDEDPDRPEMSDPSPWPDLPIHQPEDDDDDADLDESDDLDDMEGEHIEDDVRSVLITGANGNLGRKLREAWGDAYDLILIDENNGDDPEILHADLADWNPAWVELFEGVDTVIHLAANPSEHASWESLRSAQHGHALQRVPRRRAGRC